MSKTKSEFIEKNRKIVQACVNGAEHAIEEFFEHNKPLINYIVNSYAKLLPVYQKDDLYQEAYCGFLKALDRFDYAKLKSGRPESFFITNIHASVQKYAYKHRKNYVRFSYLEDSLYTLPSNFRLESAVCDNTDMKNLLRMFMKSLSKREKIIIKHRWFRKTSYKDIGDKIGLSRESVRKMNIILKEQFSHILENMV
jgi:RNA polymerase sigma factor (sigma-70 family)